LEAQSGIDGVAMSVGGGKGSNKGSNKVTIPKFLEPFIKQSAGVAGGALGNLQGQLNPNADLVAGFDPAQQAAQGLGIFRALGGDGFIPTAQNTAMGIAGGAGSYDPTNAFSQLESMLGGPGNLEGLDTLRATSGGDFLFGGQGFNEAVQAALRAAQPGILSTFGAGGRGGGTGGLAQTAIGTAAVDAFARQFGQERQNQLGAANSLANFGLANFDRSAGIGGLLAGLGGEGLDRRLHAASMLPGLAEADVGLLDRIGGARQSLEQARIDSPINAQLQLLSAALGGLPIESLLGNRSKGKQTSFGFSAEL
jgi:hypothetical protein